MVDNNTLAAFRDMYRNTTGRVRYQFCTKCELPVLQGTRQGGKSSPLLYIVYIDGLITELLNSKNCVCLYDLNLCAPTVADDCMVLVYCSKHGLDNMLNICYEYSKKWRFLYNPCKCAVVVLNEQEHKHQHSFKLGTDPIPFRRKIHKSWDCLRHCAGNKGIYPGSKCTITWDIFQNMW
ncbi:hypothetical protein DPMN_134070 [Dreissena polymorpha]|uniref:Reverse transcriptase domain-containing protein n=1 Tax=Dreissena polymorpha TaxID=45954 RepID=A0A9D4FVK6_DREPO|nr:hypothetical protein DPMN_134070 [Dreissena polymorpha]